MGCHRERYSHHCDAFGETSLNPFLVTPPFDASGLYLPDSPLSAASFAAVSGVVPVYADMLRIHGAGHRKTRSLARHLARTKAHRQMSSIPQRRVRSRPMISRNRINRIIAVALFLAAAYLVLTALHAFRGQSGVMDYSVIAIACLLIFFAVFLKLRRRMDSRRVLKSSRDSLLKHRWELRHRREW